MESNKQNRNRLIYKEHRLTAVRGKGVGDWVKKVKGLSKKKISIVITGGKRDGRGRGG